MANGPDFTNTVRWRTHVRANILLQVLLAGVGRLAFSSDLFDSTDIIEIRHSLNIQFIIKAFAVLFRRCSPNAFVLSTSVKPNTCLPTQLN
jgi:hypothetical protein